MRPSLLIAPLALAAAACGSPLSPFSATQSRGISESGLPPHGPETLDVGDACTADADCKSSILTCVDGSCTLSCEPAVPGTDCATDADCCNPNLVCVESACIPNSAPEGSQPPPEGGH